MKSSKKLCESAEIIPKVLEKEFLYDSMVILTLKINYPQLAPQGRCLFRKINAYYRRVANSLLKHTSTKLFREAVADYQAAIRDSRPFLRHEVLVTYTITYNRACVLSLYYDRYEYTGGANGTTLRVADTWNLNNSFPVALKDLFPPKYKFRREILSHIIKSIETRRETGAYFENYKKLILKNYNPENFYLTPEGLCFFFQQYDIAPRTGGIPEFIIPYESINARPGMCEVQDSAEDGGAA